MRAEAGAPTRTKRIMLVGRSGCGKTTFRQAMHGDEIAYHKTQGIEIVRDAIDTPGEYVENKVYYRALIVTAADADAVILMQDCTDDQSFFAPGIASMFSRRTIGVVTKVDLGSEEQIAAAAEMLELAGCERVFRVSSVRNAEGISDVTGYLGMDGG